MKIAMLVYPGMTPLDMVGPLQTWSFIPDVEIQLVWKDISPVMTDTGMPILPSHSFGDSFESPDILFTGGGAKPTVDLMSDAETVQYLADRGAKAKWITSVCTGSLLLGAAGLLKGYKATTHWAAVSILESLGAIPTPGRYVIDRNRATGGGVTAGIDFGLAIAAELAGEDFAKTVQLAMEYSPKPPFTCGTPEEATPELVERVQNLFAEAV